MTSNLIDPDAIGVELSWSFGDGDAESVTMPRTTLAALLTKHGFDPELVGEMSEDLALRKACHTVKGRSKTIVIQELRRPNKDTPRAFGIYKVIAKEGEAGDDVVMGARVRCAAQHVVCLPPEGDDAFVDRDCERVGKELARIANSLIDNVINWGISEVLVHIGWHSLGWISRRRNSGGVYFAARDDITERFVALLEDIALRSEERAVDKFIPSSYHFIPEVMEVYPKPLTMGMWKHSAQAQYEQQTEQLLKDLHKMQGKDGAKMRESTVQARADECDRLMRLAETHRLFLADAVTDITHALAQVKNGFQQRIDNNVSEAVVAFDVIDKITPKPRKRRVKTVAKAPVKATATDLAKMSTAELFGE